VFSLLRRQRPQATALERSLDIRFKDRRLLEEALAHPSYQNENPDFTLGSYERLEFLGDAVVQLAITRELYHFLPDMDEGQLTRLRSNLVKGVSLATVARKLKLGQHLHLGKGEESNGGRERDSILAASFESLVGAIFIDRGYPASRDFILRVMQGYLDEQMEDGVPEDPKSLLQKETQRKGWGRPQYRTVKTFGPSHARMFRVEVEIKGQVIGHGTGPRKAEAESRAARQGLRHLDVRN
jgi:ribonuclease-3